MSFKVIKGFYDLKDDRRHYRKGVLYPRQGLKPTKARIEQLAKAGHIDAPVEKKVEKPKKKDSK